MPFLTNWELKRAFRAKREFGSEKFGGGREEKRWVEEESGGGRRGVRE